jgi:hypothetical protein
VAVGQFMRAVKPELCKYGRNDLKGLGHEIDFKKFDEKGQDLCLKKGQGRI